MTITSTQQAAEIILQILKQRKSSFRKLASEGLKKELLTRDINTVRYLKKIVAGETDSWKIKEVTKANHQIVFLISIRRKNTKLKNQQLELHQKANEFLKLNLV